jgi:ubiquinone biosynthesis accessory factor UbiJ
VSTVPVPAAAPALGLANRVLEREDWARERLSAHAGRTVRIVCGPFDSKLAITPDGMLLGGQADADLTLTLSPLRLPTLLAHPERWSELVTTDGDAALAATLSDLAQTFPWFVEQAFASALGPVIGTRVANAGRALLELPEHAAQSFGTSLKSYARDEAGFGVTAAEVEGFGSAVAAVTERVDALARTLDPVGPGADKETERQRTYPR